MHVIPHSTEAEQAVLGGLMLNNQAWDSIADCLVVDDFYHPEHQTVFAAIQAQAAENKPFDVITLSEWMDRNNRQIDGENTLTYLGLLAEHTPSAANIVAYADIINQRAKLRHLLTCSQQITSTVFAPNGRNADDLIDLAEHQIFQIAERHTAANGFMPMKTVLAQTLDHIDTLFNNQSPFAGVPTGFKDFDEQTSGLQKSDLIIIAARPAMGKTTFAMNIAENIAMQGKPVAVFSLEMSRIQLAQRLIAARGKINQQKVRTGKLNDHDWPFVTKAIAELESIPLFIDDTASITPTDLRARCRRLIKEQGALGCVVIDYLQLMQVHGQENRTNEIGEISRSLKALAKELDVPVIALSQLNRGLESRTNKRPVMSDLRESGAIEQDADLIVFIYRDEIYNADSDDKGIAEIIIGKQRNGPVGTVNLAFLGYCTQFENLARTTDGTAYDIA